MKTKIRNLWLVVFASLMLLCFTAVLFAREVYAEDLSSDIVMAEGAAVRYKNSEEEIDKSGIRFDAYVSESYKAANEGATYGMLLIPAEMLGAEEELTVDTANAVNQATEVWRTASDKEGYDMFSTVLYGIPESGYGTVIAARAYILNEGVYTYSDVQKRSVAQVASMALAAGDEHTKELNAYVDGALKEENGGSFTIPETLTLGMGFDTALEVSVSPAELVPTYASENEKIVTVTKDGTVTAVGEGTANIVVTLGSSVKKTAVTVIDANYRVIIPALDNGTSNALYTLPVGTLVDGANRTVSEGISWSYNVTYKDDSAAYETTFDAIAVDNGTFTPKMAGKYAVEYVAEYNGEKVSATATLEIARPDDAKENEIESFNNPASVAGVYLQSGSAFAETYLAKGSDKLPAGVEGGVSFDITDSADGNGSWPNLQLISRADVTEIQKYDYVSVLYYVGVKEEKVSEITEIMVHFEFNGTEIKFAPNTWVTLNIPAEKFQDRTNLFWVQNGAPADVIDEIRIASVYAYNSSAALDLNTIGATTGWNAWGDSGIKTDTNTTDKYYDRSFAPAGCPEDSARVIRLVNDETVGYNDSGKKYGNFYIRPTMTKEELQQAQAEGYKSVTLNVYIDSNASNVQLSLLPDQVNVSEQYPTKKWVQLSFSLANFIGQYNGQIKLLWVEVDQNNPLSAVWLSGFRLAKDDIVSFDNDMAASYFYTTSGTITYETDLSGLNGTPADISGAVKIASGASDMNIRILSGQREVYNDSSKKITMKVYIVAEGETVSAGLYHDGKVQTTVDANTWTTITFNAKDDSGDNGIYNVWNWFADGTHTGWLKFDANTISAIYIAGLQIV